MPEHLVGSQRSSWSTSVKYTHITVQREHTYLIVALLVVVSKGLQAVELHQPDAVGASVRQGLVVHEVVVVSVHVHHRPFEFLHHLTHQQHELLEAVVASNTVIICRQQHGRQQRQRQ